MPKCISFGISYHLSAAIGRGVDSGGLVLRAFLGGDGAGTGTLIDRGRMLAVMIEDWLVASHEGLNWR